LASSPDSAIHVPVFVVDHPRHEASVRLYKAKALSKQKKKANRFVRMSCRSKKDLGDLISHDRLCLAEVLAIIEKRSFLNGLPTEIAVGRMGMDQSSGCGGRRPRTCIRSASAEVPSK
jgi:hypothetical protein